MVKWLRNYHTLKREFTKGSKEEILFKQNQPTKKGQAKSKNVKEIIKKYFTP